MWTKEQSRKWKEKHAHICLDCGRPCSYTALRCRQCNNLNRRQDILQFCPDCSKPINRRKRTFGIKHAATRCRSCALKHSWATGKKSAEDLPRREKSFNWKGGIVKDSAGYILILRPEHPRANKKGYVLEHLLIWEEAHGKPLPKGWIIHHLNGIKDDNRPQNLEALPNKKHYHVLQAKAKRIQELEALLNGQHQLL